MTIGRTLLISFLLHSIAIYAAAPALMPLSAGERTFMIEMKELLFLKDTSGKEDKTKPMKKRLKTENLKKTAPVIHRAGSRKEIADILYNEYHEETAGQTPEIATAPAEGSLSGKVYLPEKTGISTMELNEIASEYFSVHGQMPHTAGSSRKTAAIPPQDNLGEYNQSLVNQLRDIVEKHLAYPPLARKRNMEGTVILQFRVTEKGIPAEVKVVKSSQHKILDDEAVKTVMRAAPLPPMRGSIEIPISFRLSPSSLSGRVPRQ